MLQNIDATIERRLLVNYRADPDVVARLLPAPFVPRLLGGHAMAGICLIHLRHARPAGMPALLGIETQGVAHRIAVRWPQADGTLADGVYIPRRDTASWMVATATAGSLGSRRADFTIDESDDAFDIAMTSRDGGGSLHVIARATGGFENSALGSLGDAHAFFRDGGPGFSPTRDGRFAGIDLTAEVWKLDPVAVTGMEAAWFDDLNRFPQNAAVFDSALVMRRTSSQWRGVPGIGS